MTQRLFRRLPSAPEPNDKGFAGLQYRKPTDGQKTSAGRGGRIAHENRKLDQKLDELLGRADYDEDEEP